ncbi:MAG: helix-turn-helix domain-containing protein [Chloroflexota bacterium]
MKYTRRQKQHAIYLLRELEDLPEVSRRLNIPERTLRDWRSQSINFDIRPRQDPAALYRTRSDDITLEDIRDRLLEQVDTLSSYSGEDPRKAYFAALAIDRYLQQIITLNEAIGEQFDDEPSAEIGGES